VIKSEVVKTWKVSCEVCGSYAPNALSEDGARKNAKHTGWAVISGRDICPKCKADFVVERRAWHAMTASKPIM